MKEGDFKMPSGQSGVQGKYNKDMMLEEFGESDGENNVQNQERLKSS
jgi:hypothetical protein